VPSPGGTVARGYGAAHRAARERLRPLVERGGAVCVFCSRPIAPGSPWDLDHTADRSAYRGPAHVRCNRRAGGRNGGRVRARRRALRRLVYVNASRQW